MMVYIAVENKCHQASHTDASRGFILQRRVCLAVQHHLSQRQAFASEDNPVPPLPKLPAAQEHQHGELHVGDVIGA
jgi:hypothetical protein